ncbi:MAG: type II secretion system F family protein [Eggerthellaceae bacterium]|jgi:tight adherence protein B
MEAGNWYACIAFVTAFFSGAFLCAQFFRGFQSLSHSVRSLRIQGDAASLRAGKSLVFRNGIRVFLPASRILLGTKRGSRFIVLMREYCRLRDWPATEQGIASIFIALELGTVLVGWIVSSLVFGIVAALTATLLVYVVAKQACEFSRERLRDEIPSVLRSMNACFHAGYTLLQTFRQVADETEGDMSTYFTRAAAGLETGKTVDQVLGELREHADLPELGFVIVALEVQHRTGGSLREIIDAACDAVSEDLSLRRSLRVQTAQARLSARVVTVMPFVLIALLSLFTDNFLAPFFSSPAGFFVLSLALAMQAAGILAVRKVLEVRET